MIKLILPLLTSLLLCVLCTSRPVSAGELSFSWGEGSSRYKFKVNGEITPDAMRIAYIHPTDWQWRFENDHKLSVEIELGGYHWKDPVLKDSKNGVVLQPMWRYFIPLYGDQLYFGIGVGLAYTDSDKWMDRKLGSRFLFEDKFEIGIKFTERHRFSFSLNHYSNANIADINHGANVYYFNYSLHL